MMTVNLLSLDDKSHAYRDAIRCNAEMEGTRLIEEATAALWASLECLKASGESRDRLLVVTLAVFREVIDS